MLWFGEEKRFRASYSTGTRQGFVYVDFVIGAFARRIVGFLTRAEALDG